MTKKIYIDSCVLILALKASEDAIASRAIAEISQDDAEYFFSPVTVLEVMPAPMRNGKHEQVEFYDAWFGTAKQIWYDDTVHQNAVEQATKHAIQPLDAVHVASAIVAGASELVTAEKATKPMFTSTEMKVRSIR
ncbi:PIN domain-containing protein [Luteibacter rhizovicinus]|uniref:PIN domain-containing protein n=1 Tax=Luteibacter rhizovicinus TaxID=242606 RepID=A0A4R3YYV0_9GAMM|nr:type II toxin-antitoxin system VapC family toxin [Luteibacter rhizovicinus]TCV97732.1 PIN domain-containing protein [Luteibacter rhizovicinus]